MNKRQRVEATLAGRKADRAPVSFWHHFRPDQVRGPAAIEAHLHHLQTYDLDFLKIMNDNGYPRPQERLTTAKDLGGLRAASGTEKPFADQLAVIQSLRRSLGPDIFCCTTVFNCWSILRSLAAPASDQHGPPVMSISSEDARERATRTWLQQDRTAVVAALEAIGDSLAGFARSCILAGADGIYLSCRDDWVEGPGGAPGTYDELVKPQDLKILHACREARFNFLHVCGQAINYRRFAEYPVHVLSWADRQCGPSVQSAAGWVRPTICCGVDNLVTIVKGTAQECAEEVRDALRQAGPRPIIIAPGCTYDPAAVPQANLQAIRQAVEG